MILNVLDVIQLVNLVLNNQYDFVGDINNDDLVNILDVIELINILQLKVIIICSILISIVGIMDDLKSLSPLLRLIFEIFISIYIWFEGIRIDLESFNLFDIFNLDHNILVFISFLFTILWVGGLINAINWIDGLDGLACGSSIIYLFFSLKYV